MSSAASTIERITAKVDLEEIYEKYEKDPKEKIQYGQFRGGRFLKPISITIHGRVEDGIVIDEYNGGNTYSIGVKLDSDVVASFEKFEEGLESAVTRVNEKAQAMGDFDSTWEYKPFINGNVMTVQLKLAKTGKFKANINRTFNMNDVAATYVAPNTKVEVQGNLIWWVNCEDVILGSSFTLKKVDFKK